VLAAWREQGADRLDPIRFDFIEALARRSRGYNGNARRLLDEKLSQLLGAYGSELEAANIANTATDRAAPVPEAPGGPLAQLVDELAQRRKAQAGHDAEQAIPGRSAYPELALLDYFRDTWSRLGTVRQLRQSQERVPDNAGPLNSSLLVHRTLSLMRELSPEYLHQFLTYVDALSWMERATYGDVLADRDASRGAGARKPRGTPRGAH
jgi:hypothetical protein